MADGDWRIATWLGIAATASVCMVLWRLHSNALIDAENARIEARGTIPTEAPMIIIQRPQSVPAVVATLPPAEPIPDGLRCIDKQLFRQLPNGYEQITDGSARRYCR